MNPKFEEQTVTNMPPQKSVERNRDTMGGLVKGLKLMEAFDSAHTRLTISEAAARVGVSAASARRCLLTLCDLGYAQTDGKWYWLGHGALRIAYAYAASTRLPRLLQPALDTLSERARESASLCVLDGPVAVVAARSSARRTMRVSLGVGSRLPLYCSAAGRALIAGLPQAHWQTLVSAEPMVALTPHTETTLVGLGQRLQECRELGYARCDEEIEIGVRSIAIALHDAAGQTVAAMSISTRAERMTTSEMVHQFLPAMQKSRDWARARMA